MPTKIYRVVVSTSLDQDIVSFLESIPTTRRSELLRHVTRFYVSQLKDDGEIFIVAENLPSNPIQPPIDTQTDEDKHIEYKIRLDERIDQHLIKVIESVPRKRRSEFWRHVLRYYIAHLNEGEVFIMPTSVAMQTDKNTSKNIEHDAVDRKSPGDELSDFDFSF